MEPKYSSWLLAVPETDVEAKCKLCRKQFRLTTLGHLALDSHMKSAKHVKLASSTHERQPTIAMFCQAQQPQFTTATSSIAANGQQQPRPAAKPRALSAEFGGAPSLRAEVLWVLKTVTDHHSYNSNEGIGALFKAMFSDSEIAASFSSGKNKTAYITKFGLVPFITKELVEDVNAAPGGFVVMFDESLNKTTKSKQLDIHLRYWSGDRVASRYFGSQFMGHAKAEDLLKHFKECVSALNMRRMVSISMDGPNVNWRFFEMLQQEHGDLYGGKQLTVVGTCGLHTLHNAVRAGFNSWQT